ncbi:MAG: hypothetical protein KGQ88_07595, partial [Chloroflexi bacterium]|nr:hypothetical protein [Chloroflexota bacterium]
MTPRLLLRVGGIALGGSLLYEGAQSNAPLVVAGALLLLILAAAGRERSDALTSSVRRFQLPTRGVLLVVAALVLVAIGWLNGLLSPPLRSPTPYGNDAVVLDECAAQVLLGGRDPYGSLRFFHCYAARGIGPSHTTPLRAGAFADVTLYPSDAQQEAAWAADRRACLAKPSAATCEPAEFVWRLSYPALSVGLILPWVALGWDTNLLYLLCLIAAIALVLVRAPAGARPALLVGILGAVSVPALALGGSVD